jgi:hypothetical protein
MVELEGVEIANYGTHFKANKKLYLEYISAYASASSLGIDINDGDSEIYLEHFVGWAHNEKLQLPNAFLELIGQGDNVIKLKTSTVDKLVCQGIALTLRYFKPDMTTEAVIKHIAIQSYGGGNQYSHKILRKWLSAVDSRNSSTKPGPNKRLGA